MAHEAAVARAERQRADVGIEEERKLAHLLLFDYFDQLKRIPGSTDAQRKAVSQALNYLNTLDQESLTPELQLDSIQAYTEMGSLLDSPYEENLGDFPGAIATLKKAVARAQRLAGARPQDLRALQSLVLAQRALGQVYFGSADPGNAVANLVPAADLSQRIAAMPGVTVAMFSQAAGAADVLGDAYGEPGAGTLNDPVRASQRYLQAQAFDEAGLRLDPTSIGCRRGIAVEDWKLGMVTDDPDRAAAYYRHGLATIASFPPKFQATASVHRLDSLFRENLGVLLFDTGSTAEGMEMMDTVHERMRQAVASDPLDARAHTDLELLDNYLSEAYHDHHLYPAEREALREFLAQADILLRTDPTNTLKQFRRGMVLMRTGKLDLQTGEKAEAERLGREAIAILVPLASRPAADARMLRTATIALTTFHPEPKRDGPMAVSFAGRAIAITPKPIAEQYVILAEAQQLAGMQSEAVGSAQTALKIFMVHPRSVADAALVAEANRILQSGTAARP